MILEREAEERVCPGIEVCGEQMLGSAAFVRRWVRWGTGLVGGSPCSGNISRLLFRCQVVFNRDKF